MPEVGGQCDPVTLFGCSFFWKLLDCSEVVSSCFTTAAAAIFQSLKMDNASTHQAVVIQGGDNAHVAHGVPVVECGRGLGSSGGKRVHLIVSCPQDYVKFQRMVLSCSNSDEENWTDFMRRFVLEPNRRTTCPANLLPLAVWTVDASDEVTLGSRTPQLSLSVCFFKLSGRTTVSVTGFCTYLETIGATKSFTSCSGQFHVR